MPASRRTTTGEGTRAAGADVARRNAEAGRIGDMIKEYETSYQEVLPAHIRPETFVRLAQGLLRRNSDLRAAALRNPGSLLAALLDCARLGHEPGTDQYALIPFEDKNTGVEIVGVEQYQGEIERMYRAGAVVSVCADVVRQRDRWFFDRQTMTVPDHRPDDFADESERGPLVGVYAYARMHDGATSRVVVMGRTEVMKHKAAARGATSARSPWNGPFEHSMWLKTAVHELEKWVPTSAEFRRLVSATAAATPAPVSPPRPTEGGRIFDADTGEVWEPREGPRGKPADANPVPAPDEDEAGRADEPAPEDEPA